MEKLPESEATRLVSQMRYIDRQIEDQLEKVGVRVVDLEGQPFDAGTAVTALNAADFDVAETLCIDQMIEPVVMGPRGLLQYGVVMLRKAQS